MNQSADQLIKQTEIDVAWTRISPYVLRTPLVHSPGLSALLGASILVKPELLQPTGSFKVRGAFNKALSLSETELERGIITMSAGNHAMAVAHVCAHLGVAATVCMPAGAVQFKVDAVRDLGASLELVEGDLVAHMMRRKEELGATLLHPFDHPDIVAGTGTIGHEIAVDMPDVDTVIVPLGGGGLISGVAAGVKLANPATRVIGVEPETADVMTRSLKAGEPTPLPTSRSLADGLAAPVTGGINLLHVQNFVDEVVLVPEHDIQPAWNALLAHAKFAGEPAAAVGIAAIQNGLVTLAPDEKVCLVVSGGNADFKKLNAGD